VQEFQELAVHPVLDRVHHLGLRQDGRPLLLQAGRQELRVERDLGQRGEDLGQHGRRAGEGPVGQGRVHVEDGVVEVGVRVGAGARPQQALPAAGAEEGDVLHHVGKALLVGALVDRPRVHFQVGLEPPGRRAVGQDDIAQAVGQGAQGQVRVRG
jgi:hypothetical protein